MGISRLLLMKEIEELTRRIEVLEKGLPYLIELSKTISSNQDKVSSDISELTAVLTRLFISRGGNN